MKKVVAIALGALMAASMLAPASAGKAKQVQEGTILLPAIFAQGAGTDGCWGGATRRTTQTVGMGANGVVGFRFPIEKATWGGKFVLEPTGGLGTVDLDLFMYSVMPGPEEAIDDPVNGGTPVSVDFGTREAGGETGIVPPGTTDAIVCLYGGIAGYAGFDASFKYTGTPPAKRK